MDTIYIETDRYNKLLKLEHSREITKLINSKQIVCGTCGISIRKGNLPNHRKSIHHKNKVAIEKLNIIKDGCISKELVNELIELLTY